MNELSKFSALWLVLAGICLVRPCLVRGQSNAFTEEANIHFSTTVQPRVCDESVPGDSVRAALGLVCLRERLGTRNIPLRNAIVIGFVGGFVRDVYKRQGSINLQRCPPFAAGIGKIFF